MVYWSQSDIDVRETRRRFMTWVHRSRRSPSQEQYSHFELTSKRTQQHAVVVFSTTPYPRRKYVKSFSKISLASLAPRLVCCLFVLEDSSVRNSDRIPLSVISQNNARVRTLEARLLGHWDGRIESEELVDFRRL